MNCSLIECYDFVPNMFDGDWEIKNHNGELMGKYNNYNVKKRTDTYEHLKHPYLVQLINKLLSEDVSAIDEIFNINYEKEMCVPTYFECAIDDKSKELDDIPNTEIAKKREKLNELEELMKKAKLNENQISVIPFYEEVKDLITLSLVAEIRIEDINRINTFFGTEAIELESINTLSLKQD